MTQWDVIYQALACILMGVMGVLAILALRAQNRASKKANKKREITFRQYLGALSIKGLHINPFRKEKREQEAEG